MRMGCDAAFLHAGRQRKLVFVVLFIQGLTGLQLQLLTDQRLLQLGVKDAAERHALLAARSNVLQHEAGPSKAQHLSGLTGNKSVDDAVRSSATGSLAGALGSPGSDAQPDSAGSKAFGRCVSFGQPLVNPSARIVSIRVTTSTPVDCKELCMEE